MKWFRRRDRTWRTLAWSTCDAVLHALMLGLAETYLGSLAVELGHDDLALALLVTVPIVAGALAQLGASGIARVLGRRRLVIAGAILQAISMLGFVAIAHTTERSLSVFLVVKTLWWAAGSIIGPPWSAWIAAVTEGIHRERFFAWRSGAAQAAMLVAMIAAGHHLAHAKGAVFQGYEGLFIAGTLARLLGALALAAQHDVPAAHSRPDPAAVRTALREAKWRVPIYLAALSLGCHVAVPFFTPFMLRVLALDYATFGELSALTVLSKAVVFPFCHVVTARFGLQGVLFFGGLGVGIVPLGWYFAEGSADLVGWSIAGGASWAGLEYASFQLLLRSSQAACRIEYMAFYGALSAVAQLLGSLVGAHLLALTGNDYRLLFLVSSGLRLVALLVLIPEASRVLAVPGQVLGWLLALRDASGARETLATYPPPVDPTSEPGPDSRPRPRDEAPHGGASTKRLRETPPDDEVPRRRIAS